MAACFAGLAIAWVAAIEAAPQGSAAAAAAAAAPIPERIEFNRDVRPILSDKCYKCHGPGTQMATLRFDSEEEAKKALRGDRYAILPGDPDHSQLMLRITATDPKLRMPQREDALAARDVEILRRWITQGASWQKHWAYIPPMRPAVPAVKDTAWVRNPIDAFVLARLEREGLKPSPEADRATLLRRVSLDLVGLPATLAEIDAFVADTSPRAYEKVVDRLLASPRYGERMAVTWLDAARYADSSGYQSDGERYMWRWRDWVIDAFNRNKPFDQFTVEQLAGDLLPNPTLDQRIATGFNRNHRTNSEGGVIPEEYQVEYVVDRVDTTGTVFMGMTVGCARCHSHKYDPIPHKDYYQLFSYFNTIPENGKGRRIGNSPPILKAPLPEQAAELQRLDGQLGAANAAFAKLEPQLAASQQTWERSLAGAAIAWQPSRGLVAHYPLDGNLTPRVAVTRDGKPAPDATNPNGGVTFDAGKVGEAASFDGKGFVQGTDLTGFVLHGYYEDAYSMAAWVYPTAATGAIVTKVSDTVEPQGHALNLKDGKLEYDNVNKWVDEAIRLQTKQTLPLNEWHHVAVTFDGARTAEGVKIYVDGEVWPFDIAVDDLNNRRAPRPQPLRIGGGGGPDNRFKGRIDNVLVYNRALTGAEVAVLASAASVNDIAAKPDASRTAAEREKIRDYFLEHDAPAPVKAAWQSVLDARAQRDAFYDTIPTVMVMEEMAVPRESHLLLRGSYDRPGEKVTPVLPSAVASADDNAKYPPNRLGLAQWLVNPSHPLLARVTVNRFWQMYFGTGIVRTAEDFGSQGELPSHPELLDWLATEFVRTKWDVKAMQKAIVMSATYRQSSKASAEQTQQDPDNRLLARGPRFRLPAPVVRDQALALAGLLVNKVGGPSVKPYQPPGLWEELADETYVQDHGEGLYRRSLYTFWRRTMPPPSMANFDASSRESHVVRQSATNTPLQALNLMNDVQFLEASRVMAERVMKEGGTAPDSRVAFAFRLATGRAPTAAERAVLLEFYTYQREAFQATPDAAAKYLKQGERPRDETLNATDLAAYAALSSFVLNLDETITKG
jgi:hypothetical protein